MDVVIGGQKIKLDPSDSLGDGGEATVTRYKNLAVKVYHQQSDERVEKLVEMIKRVSPKLPGEVICPKDLVYDAKEKKVIGFTMDALTGTFQPLAALSRRNFRTQSGIGAKIVSNGFLAMHDSLSAIHAAEAVVGDLNDMNELIVERPGTFETKWIDVDSFQIQGYSCDVATETFLDPNLYGPDIASPVLLPKGEQRIFAPNNDWYSYAVLLFRSLTLVHPYGGVDPDLPTLPKRAKAHRSVFSKSVKYPAKIGYAMEIMSNDLAANMRAIFEQGLRRTFPKFILQQYLNSLVTCKKCATDYPSDRKFCPSCAALTPQVTVTTKTDCSAEDLLETTGTFVCFSAGGTTLHAIAIEGGDIVIYDVTDRATERTVVGRGVRDMATDLSPNVMAFAQDKGNSTDLHVYQTNGKKWEKCYVTPTEKISNGRPCFAVSSSNVYRVASGWLFRCSFSNGQYEERAITTVMQNQTWIAASKTPGTDVLLGCSRVFGERHYFIVNGLKRIDLDPAVFQKNLSIMDEDVVFSSQSIGILRKVRVRGVDQIHSVFFDLEGNLLSNYWASVSTRAASSSIHGGALSGRSLLLSTDRGLVREKFGQPAAPGPEEEKLFQATEPFVASDSTVTPFRGGLAVIHGQKIRLLKLS